MDLNNLLPGVTLTLPGWALAAGGVVTFLLLMLLLRPRGDRGGLGTLAQLTVVAVIAGAAYFGLKQNEEASRSVERKAIEDRAEAILTQTAATDSVLGCLSVSSMQTLDEACEKAIFAEPQRVAAALGVTAERMMLLNDASIYAAREPGFLDRFDPLRKSLEADQYGFVANVLANDYKCLPDSCTRMRMFKDPEKVKANLANRKFEALLAKHKANWVMVSPGISATEIYATPPLRTLGTSTKDGELPEWDSLTRIPDPIGEMSTTPIILPPAQQRQQTQQPAADEQKKQTPPVANTTEQPPRPTPASLPENQRNQQKQKSTATQQKQQPAAQQKQQPQAQAPVQARNKKGGPPDPVGGLPRVTARGTDPIGPAADDDDDAPTATPAPPQQNRSPFNIFNR